MPGYPKLWAWILASLVSIPIGGFTMFYCIFHLALKIPLSDLIEPFALVSGLTILLSPFLYWSRKHELLSRGDLRPLFASVGGYTLAVCLLYVYYGGKVGLLSASKLTGYYLFMLVLIPAAFLGGFYLHRRIFRPRSKVDTPRRAVTR